MASGSNKGLNMESARGVDMGLKSTAYGLGIEVDELSFVFPVIAESWITTTDFPWAVKT